MRAVTAHDVALTSLRVEAGGNIVERPAPSGGTLTVHVGQFSAGQLSRSYWNPIVHVRGRIAVVWTPYEF